jgi:hypothetical protein
MVKNELKNSFMVFWCVYKSRNEFWESSILASIWLNYKFSISLNSVNSDEDNFEELKNWTRISRNLRIEPQFWRTSELNHNFDELKNWTTILRNLSIEPEFFMNLKLTRILHNTKNLFITWSLLTFVFRYWDTCIFEITWSIQPFINSLECHLLLKMNSRIDDGLLYVLKNKSVLHNITLIDAFLSSSQLNHITVY